MTEEMVVIQKFLRGYLDFKQTNKLKEAERAQKLTSSSENTFERANNQQEISELLNISKEVDKEEIKGIEQPEQEEENKNLEIKNPKKKEPKKGQQKKPSRNKNLNLKANSRSFRSYEKKDGVINSRLGEQNEKSLNIKTRKRPNSAKTKSANKAGSNEELK